MGQMHYMPYDEPNVANMINTKQRIIKNISYHKQLKLNFPNAILTHLKNILKS